MCTPNFSQIEEGREFFQGFEVGHLEKPFWNVVHSSAVFVFVMCRHG